MQFQLGLLDSLDQALKRFDGIPTLDRPPIYGPFGIVDLVSLYLRARMFQL